MAGRRHGVRRVAPETSKAASCDARKDDPAHCLRSRRGRGYSVLLPHYGAHANSVAPGYRAVLDKGEGMNRSAARMRLRSIFESIITGGIMAGKFFVRLTRAQEDPDK